MDQREFIELRVDDVLLLTNLTGSMKNSLRYNTFFGHFKEMDAFLEKHNLHAVLTVLSEGIDAYPEWVAYIKERQHRYTIELHGHSHSYYVGMTEDEAYEDLRKAVDLIEATFNVKVRRWYVPFGRQYFPAWCLSVCARLGLEFHTGTDTNRQLYFHYWNSRDRLRLERFYKEYGQQFKTANRDLA